jgi:hypothetical protein
MFQISPDICMVIDNVTPLNERKRLPTFLRKNYVPIGKRFEGIRKSLLASPGAFRDSLEFAVFTRVECYDPV